jgi:hypothetical protein
LTTNPLYALPMPAIDEIRVSVEHRLAQLDDEVEALTAALQALDGESGQTRRRPRGAARSPRPRRQALAGPVVAPPAPLVERPRPVRRRREELSGDRLEVLLVESGEGLSAVALARQLSVGPNRVVSVLRELEAAGRVRWQGSRRTSRWVATRSGSLSGRRSWPPKAGRSRVNRGPEAMSP